MTTTTFEKLKGRTYQVFRDGQLVGTAFTNSYSVFSFGVDLTPDEKLQLIKEARTSALL